MQQNAATATVPAFEKKPRRVGEILDTSFRLMWRSKGQWLLLLFAAGVAYLVGSFIVAQNSFAAIIFLILSFAMAFVVAGALLAILRGRYDGRKLSLAEALKVGINRLLPMFLFFLLSWLLLIVGSLVMGLFATVIVKVFGGIPAVGVIIAIALVIAYLVISVVIVGALSVGYTTIVCEGKSATEAFSRTIELVRSRAWSIAGTYLAVALMYFLVYFLAIFAFFAQLRTGLSVGSNNQIGYAFGTAFVVALVVMFFAYLLLVPVFFSLAVTTHVDLLVRKDGLDLEELARGLGQSNGLGTTSTPMPNSPSTQTPPPSYSPPAYSPPAYSPPTYLSPPNTLPAKDVGPSDPTLPSSAALPTSPSMPPSIDTPLTNTTKSIDTPLINTTTSIDTPLTNTPSIDTPLTNTPPLSNRVFETPADLPQFLRPDQQPEISPPDASPWDRPSTPSSDS
jgi:MFS family permease